MCCPSSLLFLTSCRNKRADRAYRNNGRGKKKERKAARQWQHHESRTNLVPCCRWCCLEIHSFVLAVHTVIAILWRAFFLGKQPWWWWEIYPLVWLSWNHCGRELRTLHREIAAVLTLAPALEKYVTIIVLLIMVKSRFNEPLTYMYQR